MSGPGAGDPPPPCRSLLLGVTGAVAAAWLPAYVFALRGTFAREVHVVMSRMATHFVTPYALSLVSGNPVFVDGTEQAPGVRVPHVQLPGRASLFVIMPATANVLAACASGSGSGLVSTCVLATPREVPVVFVPSLNEVMWTNRAVQRNVATLRDLGHYVIEPDQGREVATMKLGHGGMPALDRVGAELIAIQARHRAAAQPPGPVGLDRRRGLPGEGCPVRSTA